MSLNVKLLRSSFEQAKPLGVAITEKFYEILFRDYPQARALFRAEGMEKQKKQLLGALVYVVDNLENTDKLIPYLSQMGQRHNGYNVKDEHYDWVGGSLLKTFAFFFKDKWTKELNTEWAKAYGVVAGAMKAGAAQSSKAS